MDKNPVPVVQCNWQGFYIGVNGGISNYDPKVTDLDYFEGYDTRSTNEAAFTGGGQIGYNWQINNLVFGLEADFQGSTADSSWSTNDYFSTTFTQREHSEINYFGTVRGRLGWAFQNCLVYGTLGGAYAHGEWEVSYTRDNDPTNFNNVYWRGDDWRWGWTAGMGVEYMLGCHWSIRGEGLMTWLENDTVHGYEPNDTGNRSNYDAARYKFSDDLYTFRVGLNYKF